MEFVCALCNKEMSLKIKSKHEDAEVRIWPGAEIHPLHKTDT